MVDYRNKLSRKDDFMIQMRRELEKCKSERNKFKLIAEQFQHKYQDLRNSLDYGVKKYDKFDEKHSLLTNQQELFKLRDEYDKLLNFVELQNLEMKKAEFQDEETHTLLRNNDAACKIMENDLLETKKELSKLKNRYEKLSNFVELKELEKKKVQFQEDDYNKIIEILECKISEEKEKYQDEVQTLFGQLHRAEQNNIQSNQLMREIKPIINELARYSGNLPKELQQKIASIQAKLQSNDKQSLTMKEKNKETSSIVPSYTASGEPHGSITRQNSCNN